MTAARALLVAAVVAAIGGCKLVDDERRDARLDLDKDGVPWPADCAPDDPNTSEETTWYADLDGDGFGDPDAPIVACGQPPDAVADAGDCDDSTVDIRPGVTDRCNGVDDDCDDEVDEDATWSDYYADADGDGFGDPATVTTACAQPPDTLTTAGDCDDADPARNPSATEVCNGVDDDCDDAVDDADTGVTAPTWFRDGDGDGFGDASSATSACQQPSDHVADDTDCNDADPAVRPDAVEACNGADDDCDGLVDDADSDVAAPTWYGDVDGDGYGSALFTTQACSQPLGYTADDTDCDDTSAAFHPGAAEIDCFDPSDYNCDGSVGADDADLDGFIACTDCDDTDPAVHPTAPEVCDGIDNDCDTEVDTDAVDASTWYADLDADGYGDPGAPTTACAEPSGFIADATDCDDTDPSVHPGGVEVCDAADADEDCSGFADDDDPSATGQTTWHRDADGDGFGGGGATVDRCDLPSGFAADTSDCDDAEPTVYPGAPELCDLLDNDCNGSVDEVLPTWYADGDGDGFGDPTSSVQACVQPPTHVADATDCDDTRPAVHPGAAEVCDGRDNDCDGTSDGPSAVDASTWYADGDGDGFGDASSYGRACTQPPLTSADPTDCDDGDPSVHPAADEVCDAADLDEDCDGLADDADPSITGQPTWFPDIDGDGYGDLGGGALLCDQPPWGVSDDTDCDDADPYVHPAATEVCDPLDLDEDCDLLADDADPSATGQATFYADTDGDGFGDAAFPIPACDLPPAASADDTDCDDTDMLVYPGATEICDGVDNDCDTAIDEDGQSTWYFDFDGDGHGNPASTTQSCGQPSGYVALGDDCDDAEPLAYTGAPERCDGFDNDCDTAVDEPDAIDAGTWYADTDDDGYGDPAVFGTACVQPPGTSADPTDCDDTLPFVNPAAPEVCDPVDRDEDCDGTADDADPTAQGRTAWFGDSDGDGFGDSGAPRLACDPLSGELADGTDCDDTDPTVHPAAAEVCDPLDVDEDCDTLADDADPSTVGQTTWYFDGDGDGYGTFGSAVTACDSPPLHVPDAGDCNDADPLVNPGLGNCGGITGGDISLALADVRYVGELAFDRAGSAVTFAGGGDLVIGAPEESTTATSAGAVYVIGTPGAGVVDLSLATAKLVGAAAGDQAGTAVAGAGDLTGDGVADLLVGAPHAGGDAGAVYVAAGPLAGVVALSGGHTLSGVAGGDVAGAAVATGGDATGDGLLDLLVGAPEDLGGSGSGRAYLVRGPVLGSGSLSGARAQLIGESNGDAAGASVAFVGDLDGDGLDDLAIGAPGDDDGDVNAGAVYLVSGGATGAVDLALASAKLVGPGKNSRSGTSIARAGDANGDGWPDVLVGAPDLGTVHNRNGGAYLALGPFAGAVDLGLAAARIEATERNQDLGLAVAAGDVDADGQPDLVLGAPGDSTAGNGAGAALLYLGPVSGVLLDTDADARLLGAAAGNAAGTAVAAGDADGDLRSDLLVGAIGDDAGGLSAGAAALVWGASL